MLRLLLVAPGFLLVGCYMSQTVGGEVPEDAEVFDVTRFDVSFRPDGGPRDGGPDARFMPDAPRDDVFVRDDAGPDAPPVFDGGPAMDAGPSCDPAMCPIAPSPNCVDDTTLRVFGDAFCNEDAMCDVPVEDFVCALGCDSGACIEVCDEWITGVVAGAGRSAGTTALAVGTEDVYIAYAEGVSNELRMARYRAGVWGLEAIGRPNVSATIAEIAVDQMNGIHAIFSPPRSAGLRYATRTDATPWALNEVVPTEGGRIPSTVKIDRSGVLHIAHRNGTDLGYARRRAGAWERFDVIGAGYAGANSLAVHQSGGRTTIHLVTTLAGVFPMPAVLGYAIREGEGAWIQTTFDGRATSAAIAVDPSGRPYIVDFTGDNLRQRVRNNDGSWTETLVALDGFRGETPDAIFGADGRLHISFRNTVTRTLHYGRREPATGAWTFEATTEVLGSGDDSSIGLGFGGVHISHQSDTRVTLRQLYYTRRLGCGDM